jgi:hypothetical protein
MSSVTRRASIFVVAFSALRRAMLHPISVRGTTYIIYLCKDCSGHRIGGPRTRLERIDSGMKCLVPILSPGDILLVLLVQRVDNTGVP